MENEEKTGITYEKKKLEECNEGLFSKLPTDLVFDILSRLPLETISECRWVSKTWYAFILHARFRQLHFARNTSTSLPCVLFYSRYKKAYLVGPDRCFTKFETSVTAYEFKELKEFRDNFRIECGWICFDVVGTVNGLVCFSPESCHYKPAPFYICNPITREYFMPPTSPKKHIVPIGSGFCFDPLNNEYKLLRILKNSSEDGNEVQVLTLGSDSWREIPIIVPYFKYMLDPAVLLNGCLHWVTYLGNQSERHVTILSFNVAKEEINVIELSHLSEEERFFDLLVLGERLCVVVDHASYCDVVVWVMKEYGVHSSWAKEYVFIPGVCSTIWQGYHEGIQLMNGNRLLHHKQGDIGYYDLKKRTFSSIKIHNLQNEQVVLETDFPIFLIGSLISPKSIAYKERKNY